MTLMICLLFFFVMGVKHQGTLLLTPLMTIGQYCDHSCAVLNWCKKNFECAVHPELIDPVRYQLPKALYNLIE